MWDQQLSDEPILASKSHETTKFLKQLWKPYNSVYFMHLSSTELEDRKESGIS